MVLQYSVYVYDAINKSPEFDLKNSFVKLNLIYKNQDNFFSVTIVFDYIQPSGTLSYSQS